MVHKNTYKKHQQKITTDGKFYGTKECFYFYIIYSFVLTMSGYRSGVRTYITVCFGMDYIFL